MASLKPSGPKRPSPKQVANSALHTRPSGSVMVNLDLVQDARGFLSVGLSLKGTKVMSIPMALASAKLELKKINRKYGTLNRLMDPPRIFKASDAIKTRIRQVQKHNPVFRIPVDPIVDSVDSEKELEASSD